MNRWREYQANYWRETRVDVEDAIARYMKGETYQSIADTYGVTRERVRQLVTRANGGSLVAFSKLARMGSCPN